MPLFYLPYILASATMTLMLGGYTNSVHVVAPTLNGEQTD